MSETGRSVVVKGGGDTSCSAIRSGVPGWSRSQYLNFILVVRHTTPCAVCTYLCISLQGSSLIKSTSTHQSTLHSNTMMKISIQCFCLIVCILIQDTSAQVCGVDAKNAGKKERPYIESTCLILAIAIDDTHLIYSISHHSMPRQTMLLPLRLVRQRLLLLRRRMSIRPVRRYLRPLLLLQSNHHPKTDTATSHTRTLLSIKLHTR